MSLSIEEQDFLIKIEQNKIKHREASKKYRATNKNKIADYNKNYNDNKKAKLNAIKSKIPKLPPTIINIQQIMTKPPKIDKRTRKGKKQKSGDIKPFYEIRKEPLEYSTIEDYLKKADIIQKIFIKKSLSQEVKAEIRKLLNDNKTINEELILNEMTYINNDIEPTINALREHYKNDNSFKSYVNILVVIASHLKTLNKSVYQTLTKLNIYLTQQIQEKRKENKIEIGDESKIIDLDKTTILKNINKLDNFRDKLIFGLYTLFPARREEWRFTIITTETNKEKLKDPSNNYLIISTKPKKIVFNNYKTDKKYKQQIFNIDDKDLDNIINTYILDYGLNDGDYLISLVRNKQEIISQPNFSKLVSNIFYKVYNIPISIRYLRMSHTSNLLSKNPSIKEMEILANQMAHGLTEQQKYKKLK
jgi:hypothetical protein